MKALLLLLLAYDAHVVLDHVNVLRARHQAPPVVFDGDANAFSAAWAEHLAATGRLEHSSGSGYGENLAWMWGGKWGAGDQTGAVIRAVDMWYDEIKDYDFDKPGFSMATGHFTALVWKGTTAIGLGAAHEGSSLYVVMNFAPPGNYLGEFKENVLPLMGGSEPVVASPSPRMPSPVVASPSPRMPSPVIVMPSPVIPSPVVASPVIMSPSPRMPSPVVASPSPRMPSPVIVSPSPRMPSPVVVSPSPLGFSPSPRVPSPPVASPQIPVASPPQSGSPVNSGVCRLWVGWGWMVGVVVGIMGWWVV